MRRITEEELSDGVRTVKLNEVNIKKKKIGGMTTKLEGRITMRVKP